VCTVGAGAIEHVTKPPPEVDRERVDGLAVDPIVERHQPLESRRAQAVREHSPSTAVVAGAVDEHDRRGERARVLVPAIAVFGELERKPAKSSHHPTEAPGLVESAARLAIQRRADRSYRAQRVHALLGPWPKQSLRVRAGRPQETDTNRASRFGEPALSAALCGTPRMG
jgi:hypothetical protein